MRSPFNHAAATASPMEISELPGCSEGIDTVGSTEMVAGVDVSGGV
jgi:hypothetical protein